MIPDPIQPPDGGSAARLQETRDGPRSMIPSRVFVVILAAAAVRATVINDRLHENDAKVAHSAQFLRHGASRFDANDGVTYALEHPGLTNRIVSAHTELVTRHGQGHNALSAEPFTASYFQRVLHPLHPV